MSITVTRYGAITVIGLDRPERRNAVDGPTARALAEAFRQFDADPQALVAILHGGDSFCAGADLQALAAGESSNTLQQDGDGPMGPTRMQLSKPVIAAIEGYAVAGGLELALWCDLRVAAQDAILGVFCRRFGVPLVDGGSVRLPRIVGMGRALDLILTGREVGADEALQMGLVNRVCPPAGALVMAMELAEQLAALPQQCLRSDRASAYEQWDLGLPSALANEFMRGMEVVEGGEMSEGVKSFAAGAGRHGMMKASSRRDD
ncbi:MAG: crotonase/enoyl-CoA hydratase family protein [Gammaproteobacteria bacterium]|nr:crotonase/enoyl-CoA hydratase family protein [Gammaproteobacteria bacterium]